MTVASRTSADPLGPDSLTWKYFGDLRTGMMGVWIGAIQNMYPELGAGVEEHSILLREPLQRVARSVYPIMGVVYDGDRAAQTGQQIKGYHRTIKGVDAEGRRYHALNPDTFYWAHATFFMLVIKVAEYFCGGLTEAEKHQLFYHLAEHSQQHLVTRCPVHSRLLPHGRVEQAGRDPALTGFWRCPTKSGCTRARWPPTGERQAVLAMTRPWCKRPASWRHHGIGRGCRCTTSHPVPIALPGRLSIPPRP